MKHIRHINEANSNQFVEDLRDCLLEIKDEFDNCLIDIEEYSIVTVGRKSLQLITPTYPIQFWKDNHGLSKFYQTYKITIGFMGSFGGSNKTDRKEIFGYYKNYHPGKENSFQKSDVNIISSEELESARHELKKMDLIKKSMDLFGSLHRFAPVSMDYQNRHDETVQIEIVDMTPLDVD